MTNSLSLAILRFSGAKTQEFLQGQLTCDMRLLAKHGCYSLAACCDHRGRMLANFWVIRWQTDYLFLLPRNMVDITKNHLQKYAVFSKVIVEAAHEFEQQAFDAFSIALPDKKNYLHIAKACRQFASLSDSSLIFEHRSAVDTLVNEQRSTENQGNNAKIVELTTGPSDTKISLSVLIHNNLVLIQPQTSLLFTPQMIGLEKQGGVSFDKGCYVGQEIVARTEHLGTLKRHLHLINTDKINQAGDILKDNEGNEIGIIALSDDNCALAVIEDRHASHVKILNKS